MSQLRFPTVYADQPAEILAGWDRPLQEFFFTVFDAEGDALWCTAMHDDAPPKTVEALLAMMTDQSITPPEDFEDLIDLREGNVFHYYEPGQGWS